MGKATFSLATLLVTSLALVAQGLLDSPEGLALLTVQGTSAPGVYSPTNAGTVVWYLADDMAAKGQGLNTIDEWTDHSGNGHTLKVWGTQYAGLSNNWHGTRAAILFSGDDQLTNLTMNLARQPAYIFCRVQYTAPTNTSDYILGSTNSAGGVYHVNTGKSRVNSGNSIDDGWWPVNEWHTLSAYLSGTASYLRTNGVAAVAGDAGTNNLWGVTVGGSGAGASRGVFAITEFFFVTNALTTNNIQDLETWLAR